MLIDILRSRGLYLAGEEGAGGAGAAVLDAPAGEEGAEGAAAEGAEAGAEGAEAEGAEGKAEGEEAGNGEAKDAVTGMQADFMTAVKQILDSLENKKKKITSALRRLLPNGQSNEIGFSCNLRTLRHIVQLRTSRYAEWEIRLVFNQIYSLVKEKYPLVFYKAKEEKVDGSLEVSGMKLQPWEKE